MGRQESTIIALFMMLAGFVLIYAGIKGQTPMQIIQASVGNKSTAPKASVVASADPNLPVN